MKKEKYSCVIKTTSLTVVILLFAYLVYDQLMTVKEGTCYSEGATVIDPAQCCSGGNIMDDTVGNSNVYQALYMCNKAPKVKNPSYNRVNNCFVAPAVRPVKTDCCSTSTVIQHDNGKNDAVPGFACQ